MIDRLFKVFLAPALGPRSTVTRGARSRATCHARARWL